MYVFVVVVFNELEVAGKVSTDFFYLLWFPRYSQIKGANISVKLEILKCINYEKKSSWLSIPPKLIKRTITSHLNWTR